MPLTPFSPRFGEEDNLPTSDATPPLKSPVGLRHFHAVDASREDVSTGTRQFMVTAFYPGTSDLTAPRARVTDIVAPQVDEAFHLLARDAVSAVDKAEVFTRLQALTLRAQRELAPKDTASCPVLIYYPGGQAHRLSNAALCEALAAQGYFVFTLDAPRDAPVVVFPDGQIVTQIANSDEDYIWPRVADVRFLLDQLAELNASGDFADKLDLESIGMFGHSRGGALANICAVEDGRIKAAANMDGFLWGLWTEGTGLNHYPADFQGRARALHTPILRLRGDQGSVEQAQCGFEEAAQDFGGDFISVALDGYTHSDFATLPWLNGPLQDFASNARQAAPSPNRTQLLTELVTDFFDTYLCQRRRRALFITTPPSETNVFARLER